MRFFRAREMQDKARERSNTRSRHVRRGVWALMRSIERETARARSRRRRDACHVFTARTCSRGKIYGYLL